MPLLLAGLLPEALKLLWREKEEGEDGGKGKKKEEVSGQAEREAGTFAGTR